MVDEMKLLAVHLNDRIEQREKLIRELPKDDENLEFSKGALWELIFMAELFEKLYPDFQYPTKTEEKEMLGHSPHGQAPLPERNLPSKVDKSKKVNLQGEVGGLEKGD